MDHRDVVQSFAVERYLLAELSPGERESFEEHLFDCEECALDVRLTDAFLIQTLEELQKQPKRTPEKTTSRIIPFFLRPGWVVPALAVMLLVLVYQNSVVFPGLKREVAVLSQPEILPSLALVNGNSRGGDVPTLSAANLRPFMLSVDIPGAEGFSAYVCTLYSPAGKVMWQKEIAPRQTQDAVSIRVLPTEEMKGVNLLLVQGVTETGQQKTSVDIVRYRFNLDIPR